MPGFRPLPAMMKGPVPGRGFYFNACVKIPGCTAGRSRRLCVPWPGKSPLSSSPTEWTGSEGSWKMAISPASWNCISIPLASVARRRGTTSSSPAFRQPGPSPPPAMQSEMMMSSSCTRLSRAGSRSSSSPISRKRQERPGTTRWSSTGSGPPSVPRRESTWDQAGARPISYGAGYRVLAYLAYQAPVVLIQFEHILHEMAAGGLLTDRMRCPRHRFGARHGFPCHRRDLEASLTGKVRISSLEQETENLEAYRFIVPAFVSGTPSVRIDDPVQGDLRSIDPGSLPLETDLIVFGNVLNELRDLPVEARAALVEGISGNPSRGWHPGHHGTCRPGELNRPPEARRRADQERDDPLCPLHPSLVHRLQA